MQTSNSLPRTKETARANLPASTRWLFPEYDFAQMDTETYFPVVVERILNRGSWADIRWLLQTYEQTALVEWIRRYGYRRLDKRALHFWCWIFDIQNVQKPPWEQTP